MATYVLDTNSPDYVLAELDTITRAERAAAAERELSREARRLLDEICIDLDEVLEDSLGDLWDSGADLDEIEDRYFG